jgi:hypothetical protein
MNPKSPLVSAAKWDFKPKDANSGWLSFNKKERITHISYPYQDFWCWSGMNSKGKWGLFPREFMDGLIDTAAQTIAPAFSLRPVNELSPTGSTTTSSRTFRPSIFSSHSSHSKQKEKDKDTDPTPEANNLGPAPAKRKSPSLPFFKRNGTVKSHASTDSTDSANSRGSNASADFERERKEAATTIDIMKI